MADREDDVELSLRLSSSEVRFPLQLNIMSQPSPTLSKVQRTDDLLALSEKKMTQITAAREQDLLPSQKGIDVDCNPAKDRDIEEDTGLSSPNNTVPSVSTDRKHLYDVAGVVAGAGEEADAEQACSQGASDEEEDQGSRKRPRFSKEQTTILEESFKKHNSLNPTQKLKLADQLNLRPRQIEVWFQNRRTRRRLKETEADCEIFKRLYWNLKEEKLRLLEEVQELRALKLSPQFYMHMNPSTTFTMGSSSEGLAVSHVAATAGQQPTTAWAAEHRVYLQPLPESSAASSTSCEAAPSRLSSSDAPPDPELSHSLGQNSYSTARDAS